MIQPSLTGLVAFLEGHPALSSAKHGLVGPTFLLADPGAFHPITRKGGARWGPRCWATFMRPLRDSSQPHSSC
jgi:hypothetical protein